jgi:chromosome segregation ATPase
MSELQRVVRANAKLQTTVDVLDDKVREAHDVYAETQEKARSLQRAVSIANDKYEELLKIVSQRKIEHRDQVANMQLRIGDRHRSNSSLSDSDIQDRISGDRDQFQSRMAALRQPSAALKARALELRGQLEASEAENRGLEAEIASLNRERLEIGDVEGEFLEFPQGSDGSVMNQLLQIADEQLKESASAIQAKSRELADLELEVGRRRRVLAALKGSPKQSQT